MKRFLLFALALPFLSCTSIQKKEAGERHPASAAAVKPQLFIQPAPVFDLECEAKTGFKVAQSWHDELDAHLGDFQRAWDLKSVSLIESAEKLTARKFTRIEYSVALTLCKWTPMGLPFIVSVRPYLDGPARADDKIKTPMSLTAFVSMTHHELLHSLVDNILNQEFWSQSALLERYRAEHLNVLVHLHLMAIQRASYMDLKETELLQQTDKLYQFIGGDYKRAWEIVGNEGAEKFLQELQTYNQTHP